MDMLAHIRYLERVEKLELREKVKFFTEWKDEALKRERIARDDLGTCRDALEGCQSEFEMMADPFMPSARHLSDPGEMAEMIKGVLSACIPVGGAVVECSGFDPDAICKCGRRLEDHKNPHQPETQTVCPCTEAYDKDVCASCWEECRMDDSHFEGCEVPGCGGSGTLTPEETDNG